MKIEKSGEMAYSGWESLLAWIRCSKLSCRTSNWLSVFRIAATDSAIGPEKTRKTMKLKIDGGTQRKVSCDPNFLFALILSLNIVLTPTNSHGSPQINGNQAKRTALKQTCLISAKWHSGTILTLLNVIRLSRDLSKTFWSILRLGINFGLFLEQKIVIWELNHGPVRRSLLLT